MKSEYDFVKYLEKMEIFHKNIIHGIGDDCAVLRFNNKNYVLTTDTSLLGPHFTKDYTPEEIGHKSLATNLSDIAAMGCIPLYALYALTLPKMSESWIKRFFRGTKKLLQEYNVSIIGGDTTRGPLSISITLIGVQKHHILLRSGAKNGHEIYVTGTLGNARAALVLNNNTKGHKYFRKYLVRPTPRVSVGLELSKFASSCIDISDGLAKDLKNIAISSKKGFEVDIDSLPVDPKFNHFINPELREICLIGGGEDYELCFTCNKKYTSKINNISKKYKLKITRVGVMKQSGYSYTASGKAYNPTVFGFDHFKDT